MDTIGNKKINTTNDLLLDLVNVCDDCVSKKCVQSVSTYRNNMYITINWKAKNIQQEINELVL